ncbi:MAG: glycerol-3-phosphate 1-O-acyltransferase PlsY [Gammaproteobacteria bacterium]|nr:MAG: glycerol-3-phosphate 1-O-acyltransferase PlsY [Gammaproteobacteria bacterium]
MDTLPAQILIVVGAYLLGSFNSAIIVSKAFSLPDPRNLGSGNPGATNVLRTGNKIAAVITLAGDLLKGLLPVLAVDLLTANTPLVAATGVAALLGHMYPLYYGFKGGKGVATTLGVLLGFDWLLGATWITFWLCAALFFRYSSLAALIATTLILVTSWFWLENIWLFISMVIITAFVFWRHRSNIKNLLNGTESKLSNSQE